MKIRNQKTSKGKHLLTPDVDSPKSTDTEKPIFSFQYLEKNFCTRDCDNDEKVALIDQLRSLSDLTWSQIKFSGKKGLGTEKIPKFAIKEPIPKNITDDITFLVFRFCGNAPMIGYRDGATFHIIWIDPKFKVYKH